MKPRLWLIIVLLFIAWWFLGKYWFVISEIWNKAYSSAWNFGIFLVGGLFLYLVFFEQDFINQVYLNTVKLDQDPTLQYTPVTIPGTQRDYRSPGTQTRYRRNVSALLKKKVAASQQWRCGGCGNLLDETYEVDHIRALEHGGSNDPSNLRALCPHCHRKKTVNERLY
jgi:hypothetical protein